MMNRRVVGSVVRLGVAFVVGAGWAAIAPEAVANGASFDAYAYDAKRRAHHRERYLDSKHPLHHDRQSYGRSLKHRGHRGGHDRHAFHEYHRKRKDSRGPTLLFNHRRYQKHPLRHGGRHHRIYKPHHAVRRFGGRHR